MCFYIIGVGLESVGTSTNKKNILILNKLIITVNETKLLGVVIDDQLNWQSHV